jgi:hypothetical protein
MHLLKCSIICIDLSLLKYFVKEAWLSGKREKGTYEGPSVMKKMWAHEGP